jgi:transcriptional regulator with XRE-family HTH domain
MADSFGARLRQHREQQQITLNVIADETKINMARLEALERDDVSTWPSGIFRRSFIRGYAQAIGLDPDAVVREFLELYPDPNELSEPVPMDGQGALLSLLPPTRLRYAVASAIRSFSGFRLQGEQPADPAAPDMTPPYPPVDRMEVSYQAPPPVSEPERLPLEIEAELQYGDPPTEPPPEMPLIEAPAEPELIALASPEQEPDISALAHLCTELARVSDIGDVPPLLANAARVLDAAGMIVWIWNPQACALAPVLAHGYSDDVLAKLPAVHRDADNVTAASFRSAQKRVASGSDSATGAVVVPLLTPGGCVGVLTVEVRGGAERREATCALTTIVAAQLAAFFGGVPMAEAVNA